MASSAAPHRHGTIALCLPIYFVASSVLTIVHGLLSNVVRLFSAYFVSAYPPHALEGSRFRSRFHPLHQVLLPFGPRFCIWRGLRLNIHCSGLRPDKETNESTTQQKNSKKKNHDTGEIVVHLGLDVPSKGEGAYAQDDIFSIPMCMWGWYWLSFYRRAHKRAIKPLYIRYSSACNFYPRWMARSQVPMNGCRMHSAARTMSSAWRQSTVRSFRTRSSAAFCVTPTPAGVQHARDSSLMERPPASPASLQRYGRVTLDKQVTKGWQSDDTRLSALLRSPSHSPLFVENGESHL